MHARRLSFALALAAAVAVPGLASAQARRSTGSTGGSPGTQLGVLIGFEDGRGDTGLALRLDGELPFQALTPQVQLSFVGSLGYSRWTYNPGFFADLNSTLGIFKVTPAARFSFGHSAVLRPYADAGVGIHYARFSVKQRDVFGNVYTASDSDLSMHLRFAGGILFQVSPAVGLGAEIDLIPYFGSVDDTTFSLLFAAVFRL